jgi:AcrR family transcriptional regulator
MAKSEPKKRNLTRKKIVAKAIKLADKVGAEGISMRLVAKELKVEAMSLYNHVKNKSDLIDAVVDQIFSEITWPHKSTDWKEAMLARAISTREILKQHPWCIPLLESRKTPGPNTLLHHNNVLECLFTSGFSLKLAGHAFSVLDAYTYGFISSEQSLPFDDDTQLQEVAKEMAANFPKDSYPALFEFTIGHVLQPGYSYFDEFKFGLRLIIDQLDAMNKSAMHKEHEGH